MSLKSKYDRFDWLELEGGFEARERKGVPLRERPHDGPSYYRVARQMRQSGHFRAAADYYEKAIGFDTHLFEARIELSDTLVRARHHEEADARSAEALDAYRRVRSLYASRALVLAHAKRFEEAYEHSEISLAGEDDSWYALCVRAEILLLESRNRREESVGLLEQAARQGRSQWEVHFLGGWMMLDAELPTLGAGFFAESGKYNPRAPISWLCLGDCFHQLSLYDQALFYYQRAVELEPTHELALQRQRECMPWLYGLMRVFQRKTLRERWNEEFDKAADNWEPGPHDF